VSMKFTLRSRKRRSVRNASARSRGSPQMPGPVTRMAPNPSRLTLLTPILKMPAVSAVILLVTNSPINCPRVRY
jgi:hypothetical protein